MLWFFSRASGAVSLILLTGVLALGVATASRWVPSRSALVVALHRSLSLGMSVFLVAHIATAVLDGYVDISWWSTVLPFTSGYETVWIGLGALAFDLFVALLVTSLLRHRLGARAWRGVHWFAYAMWPLAVVHGFAMGTADMAWLRDVSIVCGLVGVAAVAARVAMTSADARARAAVDEEEWR